MSISYDDLHHVMQVWDTGKHSQLEVARITGVSKSSVNRTIKRYSTLANFLARHPKPLIRQLGAEDSDLHPHYAYVLGLYLGDGILAKRKLTVPTAS